MARARRENGAGREKKTTRGGARDERGDAREEESKRETNRRKDECAPARLSEERASNIERERESPSVPRSSSGPARARRLLVSALNRNN